MSDSRATLDTKAGVDQLRQDVAALRTDVRNDIQGLRNDIVAMRGDLRVEIRDAARNTMQWLFTTIIVVTLFLVGTMITLHVLDPRGGSDGRGKTTAAADPR